MPSRHVRFAAISVVVAALLLLAGAGAVLADAAVPLPSAARAQLDKYLGSGVVGDPVAASALLPADQYIPTMGTVMIYRVLEQGEKPRAETHKGAGLVAMIESRHISAMLIYNDKTKLGKLLEAVR